MSLQSGYASNLSYIDKKESHAINNNKTGDTDKMLKATNSAQMDWNKELNKYYKLLLQNLSGQDKQDLINSQKAWESYKQYQIRLTNNTILNMQGTMYINVAGGCRREIIKQRALELKQMYTVLFE